MDIRTPKIDYVTISGRVYVYNEDYQRLVYLAYRFRKAVVKATRMLTKGLSKEYVTKVITEDLNQGYAKSVVDIAKLLIKSAEYHGSNPLKIKVKKLFIVSKGEAFIKGNQNIRLVSSDKLLISYHLNGRHGRHDDWIECEARFGEEYIPLVNEVIDRAMNNELSYNAKILFRNGKIYLHLSVPLELYIKYFKKGEAKGGNIACFDLNSDRINMVIIDRQGIIKETKTEWYSEVNRPKYPKNKAWPLRLQALGRLLKYAYYHNVSTVLYEDLDRIKRRRVKKTKNRSGNRKASNFPKKKLLQYAITMALKYNFKVYLVNPSYTSRLAEKLKNAFCLDKHTVSAYLLGLRYLNPETYKKLLDRDTQKLLLNQ